MKPQTLPYTATERNEKGTAGMLDRLVKTVKNSPAALARAGRKGLVSVMAPLMLVPGTIPQTAKASSRAAAPKVINHVNAKAVGTLLKTEYAEPYHYGQDSALDRIVDTATTAEGLRSAVQQLKGNALPVDSLFKRQLVHQEFATAALHKYFPQVRARFLKNTGDSVVIRQGIKALRGETNGQSLHDMQAMLKGRPVVTGHYGEDRGDHIHQGTDFAAANLQDKNVYCPLEGAKLVEARVARKGKMGMAVLEKYDAEAKKTYRIKLLHVIIPEQKIGHIFALGEPITQIAPPKTYSRYERTRGFHLHAEFAEKMDGSKRFRTLNSTQIFAANAMTGTRDVSVASPVVRKYKKSNGLSGFMNARLQKDVTGDLLASLPQEAADLYAKGKISKRVYKSRLRNYARVMKGVTALAQAGFDEKNKAAHVQLELDLGDVTTHALAIKEQKLRDDIEQRSAEMQPVMPTWYSTSTTRYSYAKAVIYNGMGPLPNWDDGQETSSIEFPAAKPADQVAENKHDILFSDHAPHEDEFIQAVAPHSRPYSYNVVKSTVSGQSAAAAPRSYTYTV